MSTETAAKAVAQDWAAFMNAPITTLVLVAAVGGGLWWIFNLLHKREIENLNSANKLLDAQLKLLRDEADGLRRTVAELKAIPPSPKFAVQSAPTVIRKVFNQVIVHPVTIHGTASSLAPDDLERLAAFHRLKDYGMAMLVQPNAATTTASSTTTAVSTGALPDIDDLKI